MCSVMGTVVDSASSTPVEFATVVLKYFQGDSIISGAITNEKGQFKIEDVLPGAYKLEIAFIGFEKKLISGINPSPRNATIQLGTILLSSSDVMINDVEITARQDFMTNSIDKKSYNAESNLVAAGGSANDLLNTIPSVAVDMDGNVSLRGNTNVTILIDGKPSALTGAGRAAALAQLPANSIKSVEVITNPSARYDPDGMSGIINIVTKKTKAPGVNGNFAIGIGSRNKYNGSGSLNYRNQKLNAFANYSYRNERFFTRGTASTFTPADTISPYAYQTSDGIRQDISQMFRLGLDYYLAKRTTIGIAGTYNLGNENDQEQNDFVELSETNDTISVYSRPNSNPEKNQGYDAEINLQQRFKQEGRSLDARLAYGSSQNKENSFIRSIYSIVDGQSSTLLNDNQNNYQNDETNLGTAQLDYVHPINPKSKFETGTKFTSRDIANRFRSESVNHAIGEFQPDTLLNNDFEYQERILAAYGIYGRDLNEKWAIQLGLRAEQALTSSLLVTDSSSFENNYFKLFPNAYLSWKPVKQQEFRFSYSRRINRPSTRQLNPFTDYSNPKRLRTGNPKLLPEVIDAFELSYNKGFKWGMLSSTVYYRYISNSHSRYIENVGGDTLQIKFVNFDFGRNYGAELIAQAKPAKWLDLTYSGNFYKTFLNASNIDPGLSANNIGFESRLMANIYLSKKSSLQLNANYSSPRVGVQGRFAAMFFSDIAFKQNILKNNGSLTLRLSDIANTRRFKINAETEDVITSFYRKRESQIVYLTFNYRFGKQEIGSKKRRERESGGDGGGGGGMDF